MAYDFSVFKQSLADVQEWLQSELQGVRTGRATPAILDSIRVDAYGSKMPVQQLANIAVEDARTLRVAPWDTSQVRDIERAIQNADLGLSVSVDDKGLRVIFPELTAERRTQLVKVVRDKLEQARVSVRSERDQARAKIQESEKQGEISEDEKFRVMEQMQKIVDETNASLEAYAEKKEKDLQS